MKVAEFQPYSLSIKSRTRAPHDPLHFLLLNHIIAKGLKYPFALLISDQFCCCFVVFPPGCIGSLLLHKRSIVVVSGGYSWLWCAGFSLQWLLLVPSMNSRARGLQ